MDGDCIQVEVKQGRGSDHFDKLGMGRGEGCQGNGETILQATIHVASCEAKRGQGRLGE